MLKPRPAPAPSFTRCGRCSAILTLDEASSNRYPDRPRCGGCESRSNTQGFLRFSDIHAPTDAEAERQWVRRADLANPQLYAQR